MDNLEVEHVIAEALRGIGTEWLMMRWEYERELMERLAAAIQEGHREGEHD